MTAFLDMGGYAAFVWPAYGVALLVMGGLLWTTRRGLKRREETLRGLEAEAERRKAGDMVR